MSTNFLLVPVKRGEFRTMTQAEFEACKYMPIGILRCKIEKKNDNDYKKFRFSEKNKYPHYEVSFAREEGMKITMICNGKPNILEYSRDDCKTACELFGNFVKILYPLKQ